MGDFLDTSQNSLCLLWAAQMLECSPADLSPVLVDRLLRVGRLVEKTGGLLQSRQAVAVVVEDFQRNG